MVGELADRRAAALPVFAAVGGMVVPALVALAVSRGAAAEGGAWAIPVATDIAFALGVLALAGAALPAGVRVLLLSMAVIDDLVAIALIAVLFTGGLSPPGSPAARGRRPLPAGVPAAARPRVAAVGARPGRLGLRARQRRARHGRRHPARPAHPRAPACRRGALARRALEHRLHPISAGVAVPVFALAAAGIPLAAAGDALDDAVALGVFAGLLLGKVVGIFGGARLAVRLGLGRAAGAA